MNRFSVASALSVVVIASSALSQDRGRDGSVPTCNILLAPAIYASTANDACLKQDIEGTKALLDDAGWVDSNGDGIRDKDGVEVELRNIDPSVFFGSDVANPDTYQKFFADIQMFTNNFGGTDPEKYMAYWVCDQAPRPETQWQGNNFPRYCREEYDALAEKFSTTGDMEARAEIAKQMNDMLMQDYVMVALVHRGAVAGHAKNLGGVEVTAWDGQLWNIRDWYRK